MTTTNRHPFSPIGDSPYCAYVRGVNDDGVCGETEQAAIHLSDDIVDDRCAPFNRVAQPSREVPAEPQYMKRLENAFLMAYDLAGIDASPLPEVLPESAYTPGYMDKVRELREVFALASVQHDQESGKEARLVIPNSVDLEAGREQGIKEGIERSAVRAFDAVKAIETSPHAHNYSTLQKAACVAASVRALSNSKRSFWDAAYLGKYANKSETQLIEESSNSISGVPAEGEGQSLLPCPWCGEPAEVVAEIETLPPKPLTVCCGNTACPIVRKFFPVEVWNTRTNSINTEHDELRFALEGMVSAYNTDYGDDSIAQTTQECAMSVANQILGWPNTRHVAGTTNSINTTLPAEDGQSTHTPGPWKADMHGMNVLACDDQMMICNVRGWGYLTGRGALNLPDDEAIKIQDANTRLIAAAPALYEAAVATLKYIENLDGPPVDPKCKECMGSVYFTKGTPEPPLCWRHQTERAVKIADKNSV